MIWILGVLPTSEGGRTGRKGISSCIHERNSLRIKRKKKNKMPKILMTIFKLPKKPTSFFVIEIGRFQLYMVIYISTLHYTF